MSSSWGSKRICELGSIVEERVRKTNPTCTDRRPYVALEHIASNRTRLIGWSVASDALSTKSEFKKGDILFGKLRPNLQKCVVAPFEGVCSTDILVLYPKKGVTPEFLPHLLRSGHVMSYVTRTAIGTKMPRTSWSSLETCSVKIPSENNQKKIATFLDSLDNDIEATRLLAQQTARLKAALAQDFLVRAVREKRFPVRIARFSELGVFQQGIALDPHRAPVNFTAPMLRVANVQSGRIIGEVKDRIEVTNQELQKYALASGDLLFVEGHANVHDVGRCAIVTAPYVGAVYQNHLFRFRPTTSEVLPEFVAIWTKSESGRAAIRGLVGTTSGLHTLAKSALVSLRIPLPPLQTQARICLLIHNVEQKLLHEEASVSQLIRLKTAISNEIFCTS